jgi:hypothetical protein
MFRLFAATRPGKWLPVSRVDLVWESFEAGGSVMRQPACLTFHLIILSRVRWCRQNGVI